MSTRRVMAVAVAVLASLSSLVCATPATADGVPRATPAVSPSTQYGNGRLLGLSCPAGGKFCMAVGQYKDLKGNTVALAETDTAGKWKRVSVPLPKGGGGTNAFSAVSCTSETACSAVGSVGAGGTGDFAERWNGSAWSRQALAKPLSSGDPSLVGISCASATSCVAVGDTQAPLGQGEVYKPLVEGWNGHTWTATRQLALPHGTLMAVFDGVWCGVRFCMALGELTTTPNTYPGRVFADRWNGTRWTSSLLPLPHGSPGISPNALSCSDPGTCEVVGSPADSTQGAYYAARFSDGKWKLQTPPVQQAATLACPSTTRCLAATASSEPINNHITEVMLSESWDGQHWKRGPTTVFPHSTIVLSINGLSCATTTSCTAVGTNSTLASPLDTPVAEHWNGKSWSAEHPVGAPGVL